MIDGHRHDLTEHEIKGLKKAVKGFLEEEKRITDVNGRELRRRNSRSR